MKVSEETVIRFSLRERLVHWGVAAFFLYSALTGLALWTPQLFWLASVLGGGEAVRWGHPWGGIFFLILLVVMAAGWHRDMRLDAEDRAWLRQAHRYARNEDAGLPECGRFNAGQKMLFWVQLLAALLLLASGLVLWFPEESPRGWRLAAVLIHPAAAVVSITGILVHIYMAVAAIPGALGAMLHGWVTPRWAAGHHARWYRAISKR